MKKKCNLFAVVEKDSNRGIALIDSGMVPMYHQYLKVYDIKEVVNTGTSMMRTKRGVINSLTIYTDDYDKQYYIITDWSQDISLGEAYRLIK